MLYKYERFEAVLSSSANVFSFSSHSMESSSSTACRAHAWHSCNLREGMDDTLKTTAMRISNAWKTVWSCRSLFDLVEAPVSLKEGRLFGHTVNQPLKFPSGRPYVGPQVKLMCA